MIVDVAGKASLLDVRGEPVEELRYPAATVLMVAGLPGAGKSQLLKRLYGLTGTERHPVERPDGVRVLDSLQVRNWWARALGWLPYAWLRPLMHVVYYGWVIGAIRSGQPVVVHDAGTRSWARWLLDRVARAHRAELHLLLMDVPNEIARAGQAARGRLIGRASFAGHCRRWRLMIVNLTTGASRQLATSVVVLDRAAANHLSGITFGPGPARPYHAQAVFSADSLVPDAAA